MVHLPSMRKWIEDTNCKSFHPENTLPLMILNPPRVNCRNIGYAVRQNPLSCKKKSFSYRKMHFPAEKMTFPAEECGFRGGGGQTAGVANPGTTPITILAVNSDHGLTRTMVWVSFSLQIDIGAKKSTQTLLVQSFSTTLRVMDVRAENRGRPHQKVRFPAAPVAGRNFLTPGHSGVSVRNVRVKSGPKSLCLCCFFFPDYSTFEFSRFKFSVVWVLVWVSSFYGDGGGSRTVKGVFRDSRIKNATQLSQDLCWGTVLSVGCTPKGSYGNAAF